MDTRVVITGIGLVTSIGIGREMFWENVLSGKSGISEVESFDTSAYSVHKGGEVKGFSHGPFVKNIDSGHIGRASQFAIAAARLALEDGGVAPDDINPEATGVSMGTTSGEPNQIELFDDCCVADETNQVSPYFISSYPCHYIAGHVAAELSLMGSNMMIPTACAAGSFAISHACDILRNGRAQMMLAGGADSFSRITYSGFARLLAIAPDKCQPFDKNRKGMMPGEGSSMVVLEPLDLALERGATIYAEVAGYGLSCDAFHMTGGHPKGDGAVRAMEQALAESGTSPDDIDYISAHGTGTKSNDFHETVSVKRVFNKAAYDTPISSIKSMLGHTMGAASAIEAAVCSLAVYYGQIPPTINYEEPDPDCDLDYVPNESRQQKVRLAMSNAYAFGGTNASLILKAYEG